jgi:NAD(P)-dependent dehydrogenase (short-subunit alcohol dehydrogenase family)
MDFAGRNVIVTGGASGIGLALARRFVQFGARVCIFDVQDFETPEMLVCRCDVSDETALRQALAWAEEEMGALDIYVSNAGVFSHEADGPASAADADWARCWSVNVMAHVYAARAVLPAMIARRSGHFVIVASAAGLLNQIGDAAYTATKHAAVSFAESLAIAHGDDGIRVCAVCPQYVATPLLGLTDQAAAKRDGLLTADQVAKRILEGISAEEFRILPHPEVAGYAQVRAEDPDRWIKGMRRLRGRAIDEFGDARPERFFRLV